MKKRKKGCFWFIFIFLLFSLFPLKFLFAQLNPESLGDEYVEKFGKESQILQKGNLEDIIFKVIQYLLGFIGVVMIVIIAYGGFTWMTAAGNEEKVKKAKNLLQNGLIGLIVIMVAYAITIFIFRLIRGKL